MGMTPEQRAAALEARAQAIRAQIKQDAKRRTTHAKVLAGALLAGAPQEVKDWLRHAAAQMPRAKDRHAVTEWLDSLQNQHSEGEAHG